eukprot:182967_1
MLENNVQTAVELTNYNITSAGNLHQQQSEEAPDPNLFEENSSTDEENSSTDEENSSEPERSLGFSDNEDEDIDEKSPEKADKCCKSCRKCPKYTIDFLKPKISMIFAVILRGSALMDLSTDFVLLYQSTQSGHLFLTVSLFLSIIAPYLSQYSCGIKLFTQRRTFEK